MKKTNFLKTLLTLLLYGCFSMSYGADRYISSTGNDANDGLTPGTAWASFSKVNAAPVVAGDIIHISGMIDLNADAGITTKTSGLSVNKSLTIQGTSNTTDGFTGSGLARFLSIGNFSITLKDLKIINCFSNINAGGAININGGTGNISCENVIFDGNKATTLNPPNNPTGGAINIQSANGASFKNCIFSNNESAAQGGAINSIAFTNNSTIHIEGCAFLSNKASASGGSAINIRFGASTNTTVNLINCTVRDNKLLATANAGGAISFAFAALPSTNLNIINCTISQNTTTSNNSGGTTGPSAGVYFNNAAGGGCYGNLYIKNSIIENNTYTGINTTLLASPYYDLGVAALSTNTQGTGSTTSNGYIKIENSIIGRVINPNNVPATLENRPAPNDYYNYQTTPTTNLVSVAKLGAFNSTNNSYPLLATSPAIDYGASAFLSGLSPAVTTDQLGTTRPFTGGLCSAGSVEFTATAGENIWRGRTSTDTAVNTNWFGEAIPTNGSTIIVPELTTNKPVLTANLSINGGLIESGSSLTVNPGITLTNTGTITNSGNLLLKSTAPGSGYLLSDSSVSNVTQERYLSSNQRGWRLLSNPVASTTFGTVATNSTTPVTLGAGAAKTYNSASNTWTANVDNSEVWASQTAKTLFIRGISSEVTGTTYSVSPPSNATLSIKGDASNAAPVSTSTTAGQFYLLANPYTAPVSVASIIAASTGLSNTVSYYNPTIGSSGSNADLIQKFGGYNTVTATGAAGSATDVVLPPMGAIFVQASSNGSITIPKSAIYTATPLQPGTYNHKITGTKENTHNQLILEVNSNNVYYDNLTLQFKAIGDTGSNINFNKLPNTNLDVYSINDNQKMSVSELELKEQSIPLGISSNILKNYTFKVTKNTIPEGYTAILVDNVLKTNTPLAVGETYNFNIDSNSASQADSRFSINLKEEGNTIPLTTNNESESKIQFWPNPAQDYLNIVNNNNEKATIEIRNINGQLIQNQKVEKVNTITIQTKGWTKGIYIIKSTTNSGITKTNKLIIK